VEDRCAIAKGDREMRQVEERDGVGDRHWRETRMERGCNKWSTQRGR
jgi:hypothetical protein